MKRRNLILAIVGMACSVSVSAQTLSDFQDEGPSSFTLSSGGNVLEIGGRVSGYYQQRWLKQNQDDFKHNMFYLKDMDLDLYGTTASKFTYEIQLDFADLIYAAGSNNTFSPDKTGFKAAYLAYSGLPFDIEFGYDKVPYSQGSLNDVYTTPFWSHAVLYGGDLFSRRDLGLTLHKSFWKKRINLYGGVYSGLGEYLFLQGDNDASGNMEYIGRATFSYPAKYKYDEVDEDVSPIPVFRVGVNARYNNKTQHGTNVLLPDVAGPYSISVIDGKRTVYGGDAAVKYKGISLLVEGHMFDLRPSKTTDKLYAGTPGTFNGDYVKASGMAAGLDYNWQKLKSVVAVKYEWINANDLIKGYQEWFYAGYAYRVNGARSMLKIEYYRPLTEDKIQNLLKWDGQVRVGYQIIF